MSIVNALRQRCGHDSRSVDGCLDCEAADEIEQLRPAAVQPADDKRALSEISRRALTAEAMVRALEAAAVQPPAEPVAFVYVDAAGRRTTLALDVDRWVQLPHGAKLYTAAAAVQPPVLPLTEARIEQLAVASGLYSGNPRTPGTGNMILRRLRRFVELIEAERVRGTGSAPPEPLECFVYGEKCHTIGACLRDGKCRAHAGGTGSVPPSANLDSVHPAQRSTQGSRTEGDAS